MKYVVLGCKHGIQPPEGFSVLGLPMACQRCSSSVTGIPQGTSTCEHIQRQRSHFRDLIAEIIKERKIRFVGEEWGLPHKTIACELIGSDKWRNINTTPSDLKRMGIPSDYLDKENGKYKYSDAQRAAWHKQREEHMLRRIIQEQGNAKSVLVICGFAHMNPLARLLQQDSPSVCTRDYRNEGWYRPDIFSEDCWEACCCLKPSDGGCPMLGF